MDHKAILFIVAIGGFVAAQVAAVLLLEIFGPRYVRCHRHLEVKPPKTTLWLGIVGELIHDNYLRARQIAKATGHKPRWLTWFEILQCVAFGFLVIVPGSLVIEAVLDLW